MFRSHTLLVVGAGASAEAGVTPVSFPIGSTLVSEIGRLLTIHRQGGFWEAKNQEIANAIRYLAKDSQIQRVDLLAACEFVSDNVGRFRSIDSFIDTHQEMPGLATCSKIAIAQLILDAKRKSKLYVKPNERFHFAQMNETWYRHFADALLDGYRKADCERVFEKLSIVCFNYDRCIEQFLAHWLASRFGINLQVANEIINEKLDILRPYGWLGPLAYVRFGAELGTKDLVELAKSLVTFTETIQDKETLQTIKSKIVEARTVAFLGFFYQEENLKLLRPDKVVRESYLTNAQRILGTALNRSDPDTVEIRKLVRNLFRTVDPTICQSSCEQLFADYSLALRASPRKTIQHMGGSGMDD